MKVLKVLGIVIVILAVIIIAGGQFLPKTYSVSRSAIIHAPDSVIYRHIADYKAFNQWSPWAKMESNIQYTYTGNPGEVGHGFSWTGEKTGAGEMKIKSAVPYSGIDMDLKFIKPFESMADTRFDISPEGTGNKVTWTMSGENNLIGKWMCLFVSMDKMIGKDFESGLNNLKEISESGQ